MRATLDRRGDYSVRAMLDVAKHVDVGRRKAREIATEMDIPQPYVAQILADLVKHDLLAAVAGPTGGYTLNRPASEITLLDVVEAAEGATSLERCVLRGGPCDWDGVCPIHETWWRALTALTDTLTATTFADLVQIDRAMEDGSYALPRDVPRHPEETKRRGTRSGEG